MAQSHCTSPGTIDFYIMLCTVHNTLRPGTGQGIGTWTNGFHTHVQCSVNKSLGLNFRTEA